jgi:5-formyltetrahydrofolate cyclo-ligase
MLNLLCEGKTLFVPKISDDRMEFFKVYGEDDLRSFPSGTWGIKEPSTEWQGGKRQSCMCYLFESHRKLLNRPSVLDEGAEELDVILVPGWRIHLFFFSFSCSSIS